MATRLIDAEYQFGGVKTTDSQALQWPRYRCPDPDRDPMMRLGRLQIWEDWLPENLVPKAVIQATCEMARAILIEDRTANPLGEGLKYTGLGANQTSFDKSDRRPVITALTQAMLAKFGALISAKTGAVRLIRV